MNPKVSVCIPTYNSARYLPAAIESVLAQEFTDYELIICDNASTDETPDLCRGYQDPRARYVRFDELVGQGANWNRCLSLARGEYVALLHADDCYLPRFLAERVRTLDQHPEVGLAFGAVVLIDASGSQAGQQAFRPEPFIADAPEFYKELLFGCVISPVSPVVRRDCYEEVGRFREDQKWGIDCEMWMRVAARHGVAYDPAPLAAYRIHDFSGTAAVLAAAESGAEDLRLLQDAFREIARRPELRQFASLRRAAYHALALRTLSFAGHTCEHDNLPATRKHLQIALSADPLLATRPTTWALWLSCRLGPGVYRWFRAVRCGWGPQSHRLGAAG